LTTRNSVSGRRSRSILAIVGSHLPAAGRAEPPFDADVRVVRALRPEIARSARPEHFREVRFLVMQAAAAANRERAVTGHSICTQGDAVVRVTSDR
jgi:hypothetical protein